MIYCKNVLIFWLIHRGFFSFNNPDANILKDLKLMPEIHINAILYSSVYLIFLQQIF